MEKLFAILVEDYKGIRFVMDSETKRAKLFPSKEHAKQYVRAHSFSTYQFVEVVEQAYSEHIYFMMAKELSI
jgi:hypothetical protein